MFDPPGNETLYLPLDNRGVRITDCYHDIDYYVYFYQLAGMPKPKAVYIPESTEQGVVGLFQESLKRVLHYSTTLDTRKKIHATEVNFTVSSSDPYRSILRIQLAVKKTAVRYTGSTPTTPCCRYSYAKIWPPYSTWLTVRCGSTFLSGMSPQ